MPLGNPLYTPQGHNDFIWVVLGSPWGWLAIWLVLINVVTFLVFGLDKWKAKYKQTHEKTRRIPEKTLFLLAAAGGSVGALLGMRIWHHKTLHKRFTIGIPLILALEIVIAAGLYLYWNVIR